MALGHAAAAEMMKRLNEEEVEAVTQAIAELPSISEQRVNDVLREFHGAVGGQLKGCKGSVDLARRLLTNAFGPEGSKKHLDKLPDPKEGNTSQQLRRADPQLLARFVKHEHPQTIALVLSHLKPAQSAALLRAMGVEQSAEVMARLARLDQIAPAMLTKISGVICKKLESLGEMKREASGGLRAVAEIFNQMETELSTNTLDQLQKTDAPLVEAIRQKMFVFEDLMSIEANGIKEFLGRVDRRQLTLALKGASEEIRKHLLQGMSQRGAGMLLEDMEALGPVKIRDVEAAQQQVISVVRLLESEGVLSLKAGGGDEQYIV
jgi:flagellar motor switch protein FliG